ncbi:tetraspanin-18-like isoform X2 [Mya arenaria]|nr:tetraspanin-18-like isoform X2 [Mya arenaria]
MKLLGSGSGTGADVWSLYRITAISFMAFGMVLFVLGVIGCLIATCPAQKALVVHMSLTAVLAFAHVTSVALIFTMNIQAEIADTLRSNLVGHYQGEEATDEYSVAWNYAFVEFHCCSADTYADFLVTVQWERPPVDGANTTHVIPVTCCKLPGKWPDYGEPSDMNCTLTPTSENSYIDHPCWKELNWYLWYYGLLMAGCCVGSLALEGVGIAVAVWASMDLRSRQLKIMIEKRGFVDPNVPDPNARDDDEFGDDSYVNQGQL